METWLRWTLAGLLVIAAGVVVAVSRGRGVPVIAMGTRSASRRQGSLTGTVLRWLLVALFVAAASGAALLWAFGWPSLPTATAFDTTQLLDLLRIVLTVVAGLGGVVLLAVNTRKQRTTEAEHALALARAERERVQGFNERFGAASEQLAHESPAVRLAGVYSLAGLADDWEDQQQVCVDVLCGYLRLSPPEDEQVREALLKVIRERVRIERWSELDFDFTGMEFVDADFSGLHFAGKVSFDGVVFTGELTSFRGTVFSGTLSCHGTSFEAKVTNFASAQFIRAHAEFVGAQFSGTELDFSQVELNGRAIDFYRCRFAAQRLDFSQALIVSGDLRFSRCGFTDIRFDFIGVNDMLYESGFSRVIVEDSQLTRCRLEIRWFGENVRLWWLVDCRLEDVEIEIDDRSDTGTPWLNVRHNELVSTELPERYLRR